MYVYPMKMVTYTLQPNDTWENIAMRYHTTPEAILAFNPGIDPFHPLLGQTILVPYEQLPAHVSSYNDLQRAAKHVSKAAADLGNVMRMLWEQHVAWTRMTIISIASDLPDEDLVTKRLLRNPIDMGKVFNYFYGDDIASKFTALMTDHLVIAAQLVKAAKAGDTKAAADTEKRWYANADEIAVFLHTINPNWSVEAFKKMLHEHLALTKSEAVYRLSKEYASDIAVYDKIEMQALEMADAFTEGIVKQFPSLFV